MARTTRVAMLVAILFIIGSVTAGSVAAAVEGSGTQTVYDADNGNGGADARLTDGGVYWQGQHIGLGNIAGDRNATNQTDIETLHLREYDSDDDELGRLVREVDLDDGNTTLPTASLNGTYVLLPAERRDVALTFRDGRVNGTVPIESATPFEVLIQTLTVEWGPSEPSAVGSDRELEVRSNRLRYNVNVSSPDLNYTQLETAFMDDRILRGQNGPVDDRRPFTQQEGSYDIYEDEETIVLSGFSDGSLRPEFAGLPRLPEAITVEATDTGVRDTAALSTGAVETGPFNVTSLQLPQRVDPGQSVTMSATVANEWSEADTQTVTFEFADQQQTVRTELDSGASTTITPTFTAPEEPGDKRYSVGAGGESATGTITVVAPEPETSSESVSGDDGSSPDEESSGLIGPTGVGGIMTMLSLVTVLVFRRG
ncbi:MAG: hypothetical protein J07HN4v3_02355 [Halonotius sp. J07HN4]|nr:MAG: hypothetical protein J07HN4v3_02355 [Halonotius sp. J07HN4]